MKKRNINMEDKSLKENRGGFRIPDHFLNDFESDILNKIKAESRQDKGKLIRLKPVLMTLLPAAAVLILGYFLLIENDRQSQPDTIVAELSWDDYASFDETWIAEELSNLEDNQESDFDAEINFLLEDGITTNEIIEIYKETP